MSPRTVIALLTLAVVASAPGPAQAAPFAYIPNSETDNVTIIDSATNGVVGVVPVGGHPVGVAVHPAGTFVYVLNREDDHHNFCGWSGAVAPGSVSVVDTASGRVVATVPVGARPQGIAVHPFGTAVYVATAGAVLAVDTATHAVAATVPAGSGPSVTWRLGSFVGPQLPGLSFTLASADVRSGDVVSLRATTYPGDRPRVLDAWVEVERPDGTVGFLEPDGRLTPDRRPVASDWLVGPFSGEIARQSVEPGQAPGTYRLRGYFTEPGSSTVVGLIANATFTVGP